MSASVVLSVVMPVYNEQDAIVLAVDDVQRHVLDRIPGAELVVVNDGSKDNTGRLLDELAAADARIRVVHKPNGGHGSAVLAGLAVADGDHLFLIDSDRQIPLNEFHLAWAEVVKGSDGVFGVRRRRYDPALRLYLTAAVRRAVNMIFGVRLYDANVPYKLFRRAVWTEARPLVPDGTLAPSLFIAIVAKARGYRIVERDVVHKERDTGEVSLKSTKLFKFCAAAFAQMLELRRRVH